MSAIRPLPSASEALRRQFAHTLYSLTLDGHREAAELEQDGEFLLAEERRRKLYEDIYATCERHEGVAEKLIDHLQDLATQAVMLKPPPTMAINRNAITSEL